MSRDKNATTLIEPQSAPPAGPSPLVRTAIAESAEGAASSGGTMVLPSPLSAARTDGDVNADADGDSFIGQEVCGYTIKRKLAEGGMGVVYEGEHGKIGRTGAIKVLKPEFCRSDEVVERFYQEARAVNSIRHENIVDVYDFGRDADGARVLRDGVPRGRAAVGADPARPPVLVRGVSDPRADAARAEGRTRPALRAPRSQTRQHLVEAHRRVGPGQAARLRHREARRRRRPEGTADADGPR